MFIPFSDKNSQLNSDGHKQRIKQLLAWCEDCGKYISDKTRHFQSKSPLQKSQHSKAGFVYHQQKNFDLENEKKTYRKFKINSTENLEHQK